MKVFVLGTEDYDGLSIDGIYSSKAKALEAAPYFRYQLKDPTIFEFDLDPPNEGEKYVEMWNANIWSDGRIESSDWIDKPSLIGKTSWHGSKYKYRPFGLNAKAETKAGAEALATEAFKRLSPVWQVWRSPRHPGFIQGLAESQYPHIEAIHQEIKNNPNLYSNEFPRGVHFDINTARIALFNYEKTGEVSPYLILPTK